DNNGNLISELYEWYLNTAWTPSSRNTLTYDAQGNTQTVLREVYSNGIWTNVNKYTYTHDLAAKKATGLAQAWTNGAWEFEWRYEFSFNDFGYVVTYINETWLGSDWGDKYMLSRVYNTSGYVLTELEQEFLNNTWANIAKREYEYDLYGNAVKGSSYLFSGGTWLPGKGTLNLSYNEGGNYYSNIGTVISIQYTALTGNDKPVERANTFSLEQNFPNPFNPETVIRYTLPVSSNVRLRVFDVIGNEVATLVNSVQEAGTHSARFNGAGMASGIYLCRIEAGNFVTVKKMSLLK
ncbi:MAG: T9SS type A sorting domain-containing protein, partial [Ignavibacteriales bacterium]|nr:T9SS type A sorting domain-containing protein [Ignavibacteriales bacterium]